MGIEFAEGAVTRLRREFKLALSGAEATALAARVAEELGGPAPLSTTITSIYFDRPGFPLAARAMRSPDDCVKVRTKEYWPDRGSDAEDRVVFEVKRERGGLTQKRRLWLPRTALAATLRATDTGGLTPVLAVTYLREVYQREAAWRVTVDRDIRFHPVSTVVALSTTRVGRQQLAPALAREERVVVEVKHLGDVLPGWLEAVGVDRRARYSKFAEGMERLTAGRPSEAQGG